MFLCNRVSLLSINLKCEDIAGGESAEMKKGQTKFLYLINFYTWLNVLFCHLATISGGLSPYVVLKHGEDVGGGCLPENVTSRAGNHTNIYTC